MGKDPNAKKAFALVRRINEMTTDSAYFDLRLELNTGWREFGGLMPNEWFERVW